MLRLILKPFDASCYCAKLFSNIKVKEFWNWNWRLSCFSQSKELSFFPIIREIFCPHQPFGFPPTFSQTSLPTCSKVWVFFSYHVLGFRSQTHSCSFLVCNLLTHETVPYHWLGLIYRLARSKTETGKVKVVWAFPELLLVNYFDNIPKKNLNDRMVITVRPRHTLIWKSPELESILTNQTSLQLHRSWYAMMSQIKDKFGEKDANLLHGLFGCSR